MKIGKKKFNGGQKRGQKQKNSKIQYQTRMSRIKTLPNVNPRKNNHKMQQLIKQLMKVWSSKDVEQNYQNYFLTYLDSLPQHIVELEISREIKKTLQNRSHFFNINKSLALHNASIAKLKLAVDKVQKQQKIAQHQLEYICDLIDQLRNNNILVAQNTLNFNYESGSQSKNRFGFVHGNNYIFEKINTDHAFLKNSFLRKYIVFTNSYDPFFLHHYETAKSTNDMKYKSLPCIEQLFNLSISKAYKAMKLQQQILSFMSGKVPVDRDQERNRKKRHSYNFINDRSRYHTTIKEQQSQKQDSFRLQNRAYMRNQQKNEPQSPMLMRSKTDVQEISNYSKRPNNSIYQRDKYHLPTLQHRQQFHNDDQKLNSSHIENNLLFKPNNRRINSIGGYQDMSPITLSKYDKYGSKIQRRQNQIRNQLSLKYAKPPPINQQILRVEEAEMEDIRDLNELHRDQNKLNQEEPLESRLLRNNFSFHNSNAVPPVSQSRYALSPNIALMLKNFKLKAGNITVHSLFIFLKELNIQQKYRNVFESGNWQHSIRNNQYYLHKYYINQVLMAISLCCALPETDIVIKYWGPTKECDQEMSQFLFKKFIEHIERHTLCKLIYYNAVEIPEVFSNNFLRYKDRIYRRQRGMPMQIQYFSYYPFLSVDLSIISVPRSTSKDIQDNLVIPSNIYSSFSQKEFICINYLLIVNKLINPSQLSNIGTYTSNLESVKDVQTKMIKEQLTINPYNLSSKANPINLITLRMRTPILSAFFVANQPLIKFTGEEVYRNNEANCIIISLQMLKNNTRLLFGKGFKNLTEMISILKTNSNGYKKIEFCVHMFGKRMRGRIISINLKDEVCYGDLELVFEWKDFLKGKIEHNLQQFGTFGFNKETFYVMVEIYNELIFAFEVNQSNLI